MARVARRGEPHLGVVRIVRVLVVLQVAGDACRIVELVIPIYVALLTSQRLMSSGKRETYIVVVKASRTPGGGVVTLFAGGGEPVLRMVRVVSVLIILEVTRNASRVAQLVVPVHVTLRALQGFVRSGEREPGAVMVEAGSPRTGAMTGLAGCGEAGRNVIGILRPLVILHVAGGASRILQVVISVHVALRARRIRVRPGERPAGAGVIKAGVSPGGGVMAIGAGSRYPGLLVIGIVGPLIILQVTGDAIGVAQVVVAVHVTLRTLQLGVRPGEREPDQAMVEGRRLPGGRGVAVLAGLRQAQGDVVRILGVLKILEVAAGTIRRGSFVLPAKVA